MGVLLCAAPLLPQSASEPVFDHGILRWFQLTETREDVARIMGRPKVVTSFGDDFECWQYQIGVSDEHEFSHQLVFRRDTGKLVSATRNYETDRDIDWLFPEGSGSVYWYTGPDGSKYGIRVSRLPDGRLLLAPGSTERGKPASQIGLFRDTELKAFYPWLALQLRESQTQQK